MKTSDEMWRWIWEDDDLLDDADLRELLGPEAARPVRPEPPPAVTTESVWQWVASDEELIDEDLLELEQPEPDPTGELSALTSGTEEVPSATASGSTVAPEAPEIEQPSPPEVTAGRSRAGLGRWARFAAFLAVAAVAGAVAPRVFPAVLPGADQGDSPGVAPPEQLVVAWTVRLEESPEATFVTILASGVKPPVIVAVPADVTINVPGQGIGTVGEAAAGGDVGLVGVALENLMGVRIDGSVDSTTAELRAAVDALGTIEVADQPMAGPQVVQYLTARDPGALPDEGFLRWQDVLEGIRDGVAANPAAVAGFPEPLRPVLAAGSPEPMALFSLPVVDLGADLLVPDDDGLATLVDDRFVPHAGDEVRIVVLNGVGHPGVGEEVARLLVPEGYRLMSTGNANTFDVKETKVIAHSEDDVAAAERARDLLGAGRVFMGFQPAGLADVTIVVGQDFVAAHHLGGA